MVYCDAVNKVSHTAKESGCYESSVNGAELLEKDCVIEAQWHRHAGLRNWRQSCSNVSGASRETAQDYCHRQIQ